MTDEERMAMVTELVHVAGHPRNAEEMIEALYQRLPRVSRPDRARLMNNCVALGWLTSEGASRFLDDCLRGPARSGCTRR